MANTDNIQSQVIKITAKALETDESQITLKSNFTTDLGADSLDQVELMMEFEEAFGQEIPDEDAGKIRTVEDAVNYLKNKLPTAV